MAYSTINSGFFISFIIFFSDVEPRFFPTTLEFLEDLPSDTTDYEGFQLTLIDFLSFYSIIT